MSRSERDGGGGGDGKHSRDVLGASRGAQRNRFKDGARWASTSDSPSRRRDHDSIQDRQGNHDRSSFGNGGRSLKRRRFEEADRYPRGSELTAKAAVHVSHSGSTHDKDKSFQREREEAGSGNRATKRARVSDRGRDRDSRGGDAWNKGGSNGNRVVRMDGGKGSGVKVSRDTRRDWDRRTNGSSRQGRKEGTSRDGGRNHNATAPGNHQERQRKRAELFQEERSWKDGEVMDIVSEAQLERELEEQLSKEERWQRVEAQVNNTGVVAIAPEAAVTAVTEAAGGPAVKATPQPHAVPIASSHSAPSQLPILNMRSHMRGLRYVEGTYVRDCCLQSLFLRFCVTSLRRHAGRTPVNQLWPLSGVWRKRLVACSASYSVQMRHLRQVFERR